MERRTPKRRFLRRADEERLTISPSLDELEWIGDRTTLMIFIPESLPSTHIPVFMGA
jgi:hypothetical protein